MLPDFLSQKKKGRAGFSLIELLVVLLIMSMFASVITLSFSKFGKEQAVDKDTLTVLSLLNAAHSAAKSSKDFSAQGVRIGTSSVVSFEGSYGTKNITTTLSGLSTISISSGIGTDILFANGTGNTTASGTITISSNTTPVQQDVIEVFSTGVVEKE